MTAGPRAVSNKDMGGLKVVNMADGTVATPGASDAATMNTVNANYTASISRANHTGTQVAATISDFNTAVRTNRLDQLAAPTAPVAFNSQSITGLLDPTNPQDASTKNYVDSQLSGVTSGLVLKGTVRAATSANVSITSAPATIDGLTPTAGQTFLLMGNTTASENGPRVWNSAGTAMPRATNWNTSASAVLGSFWDVREGTNADTFVLMTNDAPVTLDTTALTFVVRGSSTVSTGYTATSPTTSAGGSWVVTHNLGSKWLVVQLARVASPYDFVDGRIERTTTNTLTVLPDIAMAAGEYEIMIQKVS